MSQYIDDLLFEAEVEHLLTQLLNDDNGSDQPALV